MTAYGVPGIVLVSLERYAQLHRLPLDATFAGLARPRGAAALARVPWQDIATLFARLEAADARFPVLFAHHYVTTFPLLLLAVTQIMTTRTLYRVAVRGWRRVWSALTFDERWDGRRHVSITMRFRVDAEPSPAFLRLAREVLRELPTALRRPASRVTMHELPDGARYEVELLSAEEADADDEAEALAELARLQRAVLGPAPLDGELPERWGLTPAERRVVERLVAGAMQREIAVELDVSVETVRTHVKRAMQKAGVRRQVELVAELLRPRA